MHASVLSACQVQRKKESVPSLRHRGPFLGKAAHPWRLHTRWAAHLFSCTPIRLHTRSAAHQLPGSTYLLSELEYPEEPQARSLTELLFLAEKKKDLEPLFLFPLIPLLYQISILSSKVIHNGSIQKYTQLVMLTHYSPLRGEGGVDYHLSRLVTSRTQHVGMS